MISGRVEASPRQCPFGYFGNTTELYASTCTGICSPGLYSVVQSSVCSTCQAGYFTPNAGMSLCGGCTAGYFGNTTGLSVSTCTGLVCPLGKYSILASTACTNCPLGYVFELLNPSGLLVIYC
jgi:hypothetical protein